MTEDTSTPTYRAAVIGLGTMGGRMAARLLAAGWELAVYDVSPDAMRPLVDRGARPAGSARDAVRDMPFVVTMLPNSAHVRAATIGPDGALDAMTDGTILVDMSTIDPVPAGRSPNRRPPATSTCSTPR